MKNVAILGWGKERLYKDLDNLVGWMVGSEPHSVTLFEIRAFAVIIKVIIPWGKNILD